jgi:hypothetical protein
MEEHLDEVDERHREQIDASVLEAAVLEAVLTVRARREATALRDLLRQAVVDPAIARWMPPHKYRRLSERS